ncbi:MAG: hypothetical protein R3F46_02480 [bacterium]
MARVRPKGPGIIVFLAVLGLVGYGVFMLYSRQQATGGGTGSQQQQRRQPAVTVSGFVGGEKTGFLANGKVQRILSQKYGIELDYRKAGSIDMVQGSVDGQDFVWPSNQVAEEIFRERHGNPLSAENIFNSPIVIYSWAEVVDALQAQGIVQQAASGQYEADLDELVALVDSGTKWEEIGLPQLYGRILILSTDPTRSNSGNMFAGLLANVYNGGEVAGMDSSASVVPQVREYFTRLGYLEGSSGDLFQHYIERGMGEKPLVVGYENQLIEFSIEHREHIARLREKVRIIYPRPTVWSGHPLIAITENGKRLSQALQDEELQRIAWEEHGFRSGIIGVSNDPKVLDVIGVPQDVSSVMQMPGPQLMQELIRTLGGS